MTLPLATTTISILRNTSTDDSLGVDSLATVQSGVPAVIKQKKSGTQDIVDGSKSVAKFEIQADTEALRHTDFVVDEQSGDHFRVVFSVYRAGFGLDHMFAELQRVEGMA